MGRHSSSHNKKSKVHDDDGNVCCPCDEVQVLEQSYSSQLQQQRIKHLECPIVLQADEKSLYIGGKYKLVWKELTVCEWHNDDDVLVVSDIPLDDAGQVCGPGKQVQARLCGTSIASFRKAVDKKWNKMMRKVQRREERAALAEKTAAAAAAAARMPHRPYRSSKDSKMARFLRKNAKNLQDTKKQQWDSDDDDGVFHHKNHKELQEKRRQRKEQEEDEEEADLEDVHENDDDMAEASDVMLEDDNDHNEAAALVDEDDHVTTAHDQVRERPVRKGRRRLKRKRIQDDDSEDDEDVFFGDDDAPNVTTLSASQRVVTPGAPATVMRKSRALEDDDDGDEDDTLVDPQTSKDKDKKTGAGTKSIASFFAPRASTTAEKQPALDKPVVVAKDATATTPLKDTSNTPGASSSPPPRASTTAAKKEPSLEKPDVGAKDASTRPHKDTDSKSNAPGSSPPKAPKTTTVKQSMQSFFAPRGRSAASSKPKTDAPTTKNDKDEDDDVSTVVSIPLTEQDLDDADMSDDLNEDNVKIKSYLQTPPRARTPSSQKKELSESSRRAYESAKKLEQEMDDDPIIDYDDDDNNKKKDMLSPQSTMASPLASRLSAKRGRLSHPRKKSFYGTKPPPTSTFQRALDMADENQSPSTRSLYAAMDQPTSFPKFNKRPVERSPMAPVRLAKALTPLVPPSSSTTTTSSPQKWRGLKNLGNTCYMNASLQMLYSIPAFVKALYPFVPGHALVKMFCQSYQSVNDASLNKDVAAPTRAFKLAMDAKTDRFQGNQQRDAHEFLGELLDQIHEDIEKPNTADNESKEDEKKDDGIVNAAAVNHKSVLPTDEFFRLDVEVCLKCKSCGYSRTKEEMYRYLSVDIDAADPTSTEKVSVEQCLANFFRPEDREIKCEKCAEGTEATQTMRILSRPKALLVHLKRFVVVEGTENEISFQKNRSPVELSADLSLDDFLSKAPAKSSRYELKSIVHHIGTTANSGHYTADALRYRVGENTADNGTTNNTKAGEPQWVSFDDGVTTETTLEAARGLTKNQPQRTAYILLYATE